MKGIFKKSYTYIGNFSAVHTVLRAPSPSSLIILTILSTERNNEFHRVSFGRISCILHVSSMMSEAVEDRDVLFHKPLHFAKADRDSLL